MMNILLILIMVGFMKVYLQNDAQYTTREYNYVNEVIVEEVLDSSSKVDTSLLKIRIINVVKLQSEDSRDELVRLLVELSKHEDTSEFMERNPQIHRTIFHMAV